MRCVPRDAWSVARATPVVTARPQWSFTRPETSMAAARTGDQIMFGAHPTEPWRSAPQAAEHCENCVGQIARAAPAHRIGYLGPVTVRWLLILAIACVAHLGFSPLFRARAEPLVRVRA